MKSKTFWIGNDNDGHNLFYDEPHYDKEYKVHASNHGVIIHGKTGGGGNAAKAAIYDELFGNIPPTKSSKFKLVKIKPWIVAQTANIQDVTMYSINIMMYSVVKKLSKFSILQGIWLRTKLIYMWAGLIGGRFW